MSTRHLFPLFGLLIFLSIGCVDGSRGTILGALTFFRVEGSPSILVNRGWVALYSESAPDTIFELQQTDELGRFNFGADEGTWIVAGSLSMDGPFTGRSLPFFVGGHQTTRLIFPIDSPAPNAPIAGEVAPTGAIGLPGEMVQFSVTAMTTIDSGPATGWQWVFGAGETAEVFTDATPTITLKEPGDYFGYVVVYNDNGASRPKEFSYTVSTPPV